MVLTVIKVVISIIMVVALAEVSKRLSPKLAGILSGLPLGVGLSVYFIAYSEGIDFMVKGIPWGIAGLSASIFFCFFYLLGGKIAHGKGKALSMVFSSMLGFAAFFISGWCIYLLKLNLILAVILFTAVYLLNLALIRKVRIAGETSSMGKTRGTLLTLLLRGLMVGLITVAVTGAASLVGVRWSGVLSSFPSTLYSLVLVLHYEEGSCLYPPVIYSFSYSISTLAVFYILARLLLPALGLNMGYLTVFALCLLYLFLFNSLQRAAESKLKRPA